MKADYKIITQNNIYKKQQKKKESKKEERKWVVQDFSRLVSVRNNKER